MSTDENNLNDSPQGEATSFASGDDPFLLELQEHCLKDSLRECDEAIALLNTLRSAPAQNLTSLMRLMHTMKGNCHSVGLAFASAHLNALESEVESIASELNAPSTSESFIGSASGALIAALQALKSYFSEAKAGQLTGLASEQACLSSLDTLKLKIRSAQQPQGQDKQVTEPVASQGAPTKHFVAQERGEGMESYLICRYQDSWFAIDVGHVVEVVQVRSINRLPFARKNVDGLLNLHGAALPIVRLSGVHAQEEQRSETHSHSYIVVGSINGNRFGFFMDEVSQVLPLDKSTFQEPRLSSVECDHRIVKKMTLLDSKTLMILDLNEAVAA